MGARRMGRQARSLLSALLIVLAWSAGHVSGFYLNHPVVSGGLTRWRMAQPIDSRVPLRATKEDTQVNPPEAASSENAPAVNEDGSVGPPRDFYSAEVAAEKLLEAQKRYVMAKQRSDQFLAQVQRQYQATIEEHEKEMSALVEDEGRIAKDMEARLSEVKEVRSEVESLVNELEAVRSTGLGALFGKFDAVAATGVLLVLDTLYVSYLASVDSEVLPTSIGTQALLGAFFVYKVATRRKEEGSGEQ